MNIRRKVLAVPAKTQPDAGYGRSHGYGPAHGGPTGPGDAPAVTPPAEVPAEVPDDEDVDEDDPSAPSSSGVGDQQPRERITSASSFARGEASSGVGPRSTVATAGLGLGWRHAETPRPPPETGSFW
jgi:hypothetical protein